MKTLVLLLLSYTVLFSQTYEVNVHPGQELLTIIQILAEKYPQPNPSNYYEEVKTHFGTFDKHKAVQFLTSFQKNIYPDFIELGWCISDFPMCNLYIPLESSWYELYGKDSVATYLSLAIDFATKSKFWDFYNSHLPEYEVWAQDIIQEIEQEKLVIKLDKFYNKNSNPTFYIAMDPLNGWGAHAVTDLASINPTYSKYKAYSIGYFGRQGRTDLPPRFNSGDYLYNLIWHEGSHVYLDEILDDNKKDIAKLSYLFNKTDPEMIRQNINTWSYCFEENLVRGIVMSLTKLHKNERAYRIRVAKEFLAGFIYAEEIHIWLERKYLNRKGKSLSELIPKLTRHLQRKYKTIPYL